MGTCGGDTTGLHEFFVSVIEQEDRNLAFGGGTTGVHVEGFNREDGQSIFRFCTNF